MLPIIASVKLGISRPLETGSLAASS